MNDVYVTVCGNVATQPRTHSGDQWVIVQFRMAHTSRRYDRNQGGWVDGSTDWFGVKASKALASHVAMSVNKGDRVIVHGRLHVSQWRTAEGEARSSIILDADAIGHDLTFGTSSFTRSTRRQSAEVEAHAVADRLLQEAEEEARREFERLDDLGEGPDLDLPDSEPDEDGEAAYGEHFGEGAHAGQLQR